MARLPVPGSDNGAWGDILNEFLLVEHATDGTLKPAGSLAAKADDSSVVHLTGNETVAGTKTFSASPTVPTPTSDGHAATKLYADGKVSSARQVIAGTGLTGGGDLSADRTLAVSYGVAAGTATQGNDSRVVNAVQTSRQVTAGTGLTG